MNEQNNEEDNSLSIGDENSISTARLTFMSPKCFIILALADFEIKSVISQGAYGKVFLVQQRDTQE